MSSCVTKFFSTITRNHFDNIVATLKREDLEAAGTRQKGMGPKKRILDEARATVKDLAVSPVRHGAMERRHFNQRETARYLNISKTSVFEIIKESELKCYRRIKCNLLIERHQRMRENKSLALINRFEPMCWTWISGLRHYSEVHDNILSIYECNIT